MSEENQGMRESEVCNFIGWALVVVGLITGLIFIFAFGRIEMPVVIGGDYFGTKKSWSGLMVLTGIGIMFNGFIVGYLFQKIASLLRYQENRIIE
ncbi:hypothetical protein [Acinetobacter soli]|uniref:hypothetical protein n=1 Tax=Acinetobacter soli TaxID=487316 RepID=UPI00125F9115|nr:hypothetical protein [Acinetobacter soli]